MNDGHPTYWGFNGFWEESRLGGKMGAHVVLPWIYRGFSANKRGGPGHFKGRGGRTATPFPKNLVFANIAAFNGNFYSKTFLGLAADHEPASYWGIIKRDNPRKGAEPPTPLHIDEPESTG